MEIFGIAPDKQVEAVKAASASKVDSAKSPQSAQKEAEQKSYQMESRAVNGEEDVSRVEQAVEELEASFHVKVELTREEDTGRTLVRIMSQDGQRVIRQMPPEGAINLAKRARQGSLKSIVDSVA